MKGIVITGFVDLVGQQFPADKVDDIIADTQLPAPLCRIANPVHW